VVNWCRGLWEWFFGTEKLWNQETGNDLHKYRDPYEHPSASSDSHLPLKLLSYSAVSFPHSEVKGKEITHIWFVRVENIGSRRKCHMRCYTRTAAWWLVKSSLDEV
jgi:hypothetical protein